MRGATDDGCVLFALSWDLGLGWVGSVKKYLKKKIPSFLEIGDEA